MNYKFANKIFKIESLCDSFSNFAKDYITNEKEDFLIKINKEDIDDWLKDHNEDKQYAISYLETIVILKKVAKLLAASNTFIFHGSSIIYKEKGYIFLAPSGTGKSTHVRLLKNKLGEDITYINDDKPFIDKDYVLYGSPWDGKEKLSNNISHPLTGIFVIKRAVSPSYKKLDFKNSFEEIFSSIHVVNELKCFDYVVNLCKKIPVYLINVNMEEESIEQTINLLNKI